MKHPLLFSVLAVALAILLFNASVIEVSGLPIVAIAIIVALGAGFIGGWLLHEHLQSRPETPGVDLASYVKTLFSGWATLHDNVLGVIDWSTDMITRYDLYYIRRAEYRALDYLDMQNLPELAMQDLVKELCYLQKKIVEDIKNNIRELDHINDGYLAGPNLEKYSFALSYETAPTYVTHLYLRNYDLDDIAIKIQAYGDPEILWDCSKPDDPWPTPDQGETWYNLEKFVLIGGSIRKVKLWVGDHEIIQAALISTGTTNIYMGTKSFTGSNGLEGVLSRMLARWAEIYNQAKSFARTYHQTLRTLGFTSKSDVPINYICPPPDVAFFDANELAKSGMDVKDIAVTYLSYLQSLAAYLDIDKGCLQQGLVNYTKTTYATTYVTGGQTTIITTTIGGTTTTYTTVINGTTTTLTTVINGTVTTLTTVIGGQTIVTTKTGYVYITPWGVYVPDPYTRLQDVNVTLPNGVKFTAAEITILDTVDTVTFMKGSCTTLQNPLTAMIAFYNGTVRTTLLPSGTILCPAKIVTPGGEVETYTWEEKPLTYWQEKYWNPPQPNLLEPASNSITALISMMIVLMPLLVIVMLMNVIGNMARSRAFDMRRGVVACRSKAGG